MQRRQCASVDDGAPGIRGRQTCRSWPPVTATRSRVEP